MPTMLLEGRRQISLLHTSALPGSLRLHLENIRHHWHLITWKVQPQGVRNRAGPDLGWYMQKSSGSCNRPAAAGMHQDSRLAGTLHESPGYVCHMLGLPISLLCCTCITVKIHPLQAAFTFSFELFLKVWDAPTSCGTPGQHALTRSGWRSGPMPGRTGAHHHCMLPQTPRSTMHTVLRPFPIVTLPGWLFSILMEGDLLGRDLYSLYWCRLDWKNANGFQCGCWVRAGWQPWVRVTPVAPMQALLRPSWRAVSSKEILSGSPGAAAQICVQSRASPAQLHPHSCQRPH